MRRSGAWGCTTWHVLITCRFWDELITIGVFSSRFRWFTKRGSRSFGAILFGERSLRHVLSEYVAHHHAERPHQGKGNIILFPLAQVESDSDLPIECRERLGGLLNYYRKAA